MMMINSSTRFITPTSRRHLLLFLVLAYCLGASINTAFAAAWLQPKNHLEIIFPITRETATGFRDKNGDTFSAPRFTKWEIKPLLEWGLSDSWTLGISPGYQILTQEKTVGQDEANGISEIEVFGRTPLYETEKTVLSTQLTLILPGSFNTASPFPVAPGSSQISSKTSAEVRLLYGMGGIGLLPGGFLDLQAAYRMLGGIMADEIRLDATTGFGVKGERLVMLQIFGNLGMGNEDKPAVDYDLWKVRLSGVKHIYSNVSLQLGLEKAVLGRNTVAGWSLVAGAWVGW